MDNLLFTNVFKFKFENILGLIVFYQMGLNTFKHAYSISMWCFSGSMTFKYMYSFNKTWVKNEISINVLENKHGRYVGYNKYA